MSETIFRGLFDAETASVIVVSDFMACIVSALVIGLILAVMHMYKNTYSKSFIATIATIPAIVCGDHDGKWECGGRRCGGGRV